MGTHKCFLGKDLCTETVLPTPPPISGPAPAPKTGFFSKQVIMPSNIVLNEVKKVGFEIIESAPDGQIGLKKSNSELSFYKPSQYGYENVWECLCRKK